jgi:hypothetical protein
LVIKPQYRFADNFSEGLAGVVLDRTFGFINKPGQMVIPPRFEPRRGGPHAFGIGGTSYFLEGLACVKLKDESFELNKQKDELYGYINQQGEFAIAPQFSQAQDFSEGLAWVVTKNLSTMAITKVGWIDKSGQWVVTGVDGRSFTPAVSEYATYANELMDWRYSDGLVPFFVVSGNTYLWGYIDRRGRTAIQPREFDQVSPFVGGMAWVSFHEPSAYSKGMNSGYTDRKTGRFMQEVQAYMDKSGRLLWRSNRR